MHNNNKSNQSGVVLLTRAWTLITLLKKQNGLPTSAMFQHASSPSSSSSLTLFPTHTNVVIIYPRSYTLAYGQLVVLILLLLLPVFSFFSLRCCCSSPISSSSLLIYYYSLLFFIIRFFFFLSSSSIII